jgi:hypothetical protein
MDVILEKLITLKAKELNISKSQAIEIFNSIPRFVVKVMKEGDPLNLDSYKSIYIKDLGVIYPRLDIAKNIKKSIENNLNKEANEDI